LAALLFLFLLLSLLLFSILFFMDFENCSLARFHQFLVVVAVSSASFLNGRAYGLTHANRSWPMGAADTMKCADGRPSSAPMGPRRSPTR
jgi:hypothetical protein